MEEKAKEKKKKPKKTKIKSESPEPLCVDDEFKDTQISQVTLIKPRIDYLYHTIMTYF